MQKIHIKLYEIHIMNMTRLKPLKRYQKKILKAFSIKELEYKTTFLSVIFLLQYSIVFEEELV